MKKYTIIYSVPVGNHCRIANLDRVETDQDIVQFISQDKYNNSVTFVFKGWPEMADEFV
jgi:hypothetical protein